MKLASALAAACILVALPSAQVRFGAMGDSTTDEYLWYGPFVYGSDTALNWVQVLAALRDTTSATPQIDFGPEADWGPTSPQWLGYEHNYAKAGATTSSLLADAQPQNVLTHNPDVVYLGIGFNDVFAQYGAIYDGADPAPLVSSVVANVTAAVDVVHGPPGAPTGVGLVLATVEDPEIVPSILVDYPDPAKRALVSGAIFDVNQAIRALAAARGFALVELYALTQEYPAPAQLVVGGTTILPGGPPAGDDPQYFYLPDELHYGTVFNGLIANAIVCAANARYCANVAPLSDAEILQIAGLGDPGTTSYFDVEPFVVVNGGPCATPWTDLGFALAGTHGEPSLAGSGLPMPLKTVGLALTGALENAPAGIAVGSSTAFLPFFGGVLVPAPDQVLFAPTDAQGNVTIQSTWPVGIPSGFGLAFQFLVFDPLAPQSVSLSNGLRLVVP